MEKQSGYQRCDYKYVVLIPHAKFQQMSKNWRVGRSGRDRDKDGPFLLSCELSVSVKEIPEEKII